jgi:peptidoglycan biosynthesis protein MviN/MurJ (putative lipid II flippase)
MLFLTYVTIGLNLTFIPVYSISGAALATAIAFIIHNFIMLTFVKWKLNLHPFSINMLKIFAVIAGILLLNYALPTVTNLLIDSLYRTAVLAGLAGVSVYYWRISEDINSVIKSFLRRDKVSSL